MSDIYSLSEGTSALINDVRREKYMQPAEATWTNTCYRVARALCEEEPESLADLLVREIVCPGGRVMAGAGTTKNVTWWNCFVAPLLQDSMRTDPGHPGKGIMNALGDVAYSMQMGGGVGTDFSPLRPEGALVKRLDAAASGPLAFMDTWDAMCRTVMSAGARRGAMMATLICWHADLRRFIHAKRDPRRLRMFNVSVLVTDAFMRAVEQDDPWELGHWEPPRGHTVEIRQRFDPYRRCERDWFVYETISAKELWREIMESNYKYAEPGVIFIDRVNKMNNLWYAEHVQCSNPCGEQCLAPDDNCNLSHVNLSRCITGTPFTSDCKIDHSLIEHATRILVRMSDRVIDLSPVPTEAQCEAAQSKRRIGLGITGLANALMFVGKRYGSREALEETHRIMSTLRDAAYSESVSLARRFGPFPLFHADYLKGRYITGLPGHLQASISQHGVRNALLLTVAPVGTMSIANASNASSGLEPVFMPRYTRKKLEADDSFSEHIVEDFGFRVYANVVAGGDMERALAGSLPSYMVTTQDLRPSDHLETQAAVQVYVDNSVSKTINVPEQTSFEDFADIYTAAYTLGCKGCTTYRPDPESGRGEVLSAISPQKTVLMDLRDRPDKLTGATYKVRWSELPAALYVTINDEIRADGSRLPYEVFINSKSVEHAHWQAALTRMISAIMRKGGDITFIPEELKQVHSAAGGEWIEGRYVPSEVALIGHVLERHFREIGYIASSERREEDARKQLEPPLGRECRSCGERAVVKEESCERCLACGWSNCG